MVSPRFHYLPLIPLLSTSEFWIVQFGADYHKVPGEYVLYFFPDGSAGDEIL